ncbi:PAS domain S-box protein, partial [bacterium]|nr:PAS domain S-box protein [bacterium]
MNLRAKILARSVMLSVCLIALIVAAHTVFAFHFHRHQVDAQYVDQIVFQAAELERQILWNDRISTTRLLESVIAADDCVAYAFVELGGRPYAHTFASGIPRTLLGTPSSSEVVDRHFRDENGLGFHEMFVRVGDTDAVLHVGHSTNRASREAIRLLGRIFGIGIAAALVSVFFSMLLARWTTREVNAATAALSTSEERYRAVAEDSPVMICRFLPGGEITYANDAYSRCFEKTTAELIGSSFMPLIPESDRGAVMANISALTPDSPTRSHEHRVIGPDGAVRWHRWTNHALFGDADNPVAYQATGEDVTARRQAEEALHESEERLRSIVEHSTNIFYSHTPEHVLTYISPQSRNYLECEPEEALPRWTEFATDNPINERGFALTEEAIRTGKSQPPYELELEGVYGRRSWMEVREAPIVKDGRTVAMVGSLTDITDRKRAEDALRESEENAHAMLNATSEIAMLLSPDGNLVAANESAAATFGLTPEELVGTRPFQFATQEVAERRWKTFRALLADKTPHRFEDESGGRYFDNSTRPILDDDGNVRLVAVFARDITDRKCADEERERLMSAIEQAAETIVITDSDGTIQYVNPAFGRITGYTRAEVIGQNPRVLKSGEQDDAFYKEMWDTLTRGEVWSGRFVNKKKDGSFYTEEATISPVRDASGATINYVAVKRDITQETALEDQLRQSHKMEAVGQLAGGVAHDLNNMLTPILGYSELLQQKLDRDDGRRDFADEIVKAGLAAKDLVHQLLAFGRKQTLEYKTVDL